MLLTIGYALFNGTDYVSSLTYTYTDLAFFITNHHDGSEAKLLTTFNHLGNTANLNNALLPISLLFAVSIVLTTFCHI